MISVLELFTIISIIVIFGLAYFFLQLDKIRTNNRHYVYLLLGTALLIYCSELTVLYEIYFIAYILFPLYLTSFYLIYPLFYLYTKRLVYTSRELADEKTINYFMLPIIIFVMCLFFYIPLNEDQKLSMIDWDGDFFVPQTAYDYFLFVSLFFYYLQFIVFVYMFFRLLHSAKRNMSDKIIDKNIAVRWIKGFVTLIIVYEFVTAVLLYVLEPEVYNISAQAVSFVFLLFLGLLRVNHTTIEIQTRLRRAKLNLNEEVSDQKQYLLSEYEKKELLDLINKALKSKKLFLDPNLKIEQFAKKIHVSARKLSNVINEITGDNFSNLLNKYRIEEAVKTIKDSDKNFSLEDVYIHAGFNSRSTFNRAFKSITGMTPSEYKTIHPN